MSNADQDLVVTALHGALLTEDTKYAYMESNLNPLRNNMQLIDTLNQMK